MLPLDMTDPIHVFGSDFPQECQAGTHHRPREAGAFLGLTSFSNPANPGPAFLRGAALPFPQRQAPLPGLVLPSPRSAPVLPPSRRRGPRRTPGQKRQRLGCQAGAAAQARPRAPRTLRGGRRGAGRAGHGRAAEARAAARQGLAIPGGTGRGAAPQPVPRSLPQVSAPEPTPNPRRHQVPARAPRGQSAARRPGRHGPRAGRTPRLPGPAARPLHARVYGSVPPRAARRGQRARPGRDSWVPKGLSRQRGGPSAPRAAGAPRAGPSAHAPARPPVTCGRVRAPPPPGRSLPGAAPQPAPRLGAAHPAGYSDTARGGGALGNYHILAYRCASRGFPSQWSLWEGGAWSGHA